MTQPPRLPAPLGDSAAEPKICSTEEFILTFKPEVQELSDLGGEEADFALPGDKPLITRQAIRDALVRAEEELLGRMELTYDSRPTYLEGLLKQCVMDIARYRMDFIAAREDGKDRCDSCLEMAEKYRLENKQPVVYDDQESLGAFSI